MIDHAQRAGDQRLVARGASGYASTAVFGSQPVGTVIVECERLLTLVHGDRKAEAWIAQELAQLHAMQGHFERARELYRQGQQALRELGPSVSAMTTSIRSSRVEVLAGDLATAEAELRRDAADLETIGETYYRSTVTITLARVVLAQGRIEEADEYCRITEGLADPDDVDSQILLRSTRARILARRSSDAKAVQLVGEAVAKSAETADLLLRADVLVDQSDVLRDLGRHDASRAPLLEALTLYEQKGDEISAGRVRGRLEDLAAVV
jgi:ATP/maltotriose-dependent transcriptional regulator MalT